MYRCMELRPPWESDIAQLAKKCPAFNEIRNFIYIKMIVFWDAVQCSLVEINLRFRGAYSLHPFPQELTPGPYPEAVKSHPLPKVLLLHSACLP